MKTPSWGTILLLFFPLWFVHAFADPLTMSDTPEYCQMFEDVKEIPFRDIILRNLPYEYVRIELGWLLFNKLLTIVFSNPQVLIIIDSTLILSGYAFIIKKYSPTPWLSVVIFLCTLYPQSLFVLRQHTALAICLFSLPFILERKIKPFILIIAIAASIHTSALLFGIVYYIYNVKISWKFYVVLFISTIVVYVAGMFLLNFFMGIGLLDEYFKTYFEAVSNYSTLIINLLEFLFVYFFVRSGKKLRDINKLSFLLLLLMLSLSVVALSTPLGGRLSVYFSFCQILIFPLCVAMNRKKALLNIFIAIIFILYAFVRMNSTWEDANLGNMSLIF